MANRTRGTEICLHRWQDVCQQLAKMYVLHDRIVSTERSSLRLRNERLERLDVGDNIWTVAFSRYSGAENENQTSVEDEGVVWLRVTSRVLECSSVPLDVFDSKQMSHCDLAHAIHFTFRLRLINRLSD